MEKSAEEQENSLKSTEVDLNSYDGFCLSGTAEMGIAEK